MSVVATRPPSGSQDRERELRERIARRVALELRPGQLVNLGIGIPTLVARYVDSSVFLQSENGILGMGPPATPEQVDRDLINASREYVTELPGAVYFDSATSFAMIRGGHVDVAVVGALEVDEAGNLANWSLPGGEVLGVGGAMDLACGARRVIVAMSHTTRDGRPKLVRRCSLPLTARGVVDTVVTELAVFRFIRGRLHLVEVMEGLAVEDIRAMTEARFECMEVGPYRQ